MPQPKLLEQVRRASRARNHSPRTTKAYVYWIRRFVVFHEMRHPRDLGLRHVNRFLEHLAVDEDVAASTQNQAASALVFLYAHVLHQPMGKPMQVARAKRPKP
jgi:site-specific recombinase XerD